MSRLVATIDLSSAVVGSQGTFDTQTPNNCSALYVMNESAMFLQLDLGVNGQPIVQPWRNRLFTLKQTIQNAQWTVIAVLTSASAPSASVYVEAFAPNETPSASLDGPVFRQSNVGNGSLPVTNSSTLINDGNPAGTVIVEATPSGAAGSQAKLTNDGAFLCGGGLFSISNAGVVTTIPAGSIPASGVGSGYPAASLAAGALPSGVTIAASQVGSGYPGADVSGAVASATNATNATNATTATNLGGGPQGGDNATYLTTEIDTQRPAGSARSLLLTSWDGAASHNAFSIGTNGYHGSSYIDDVGTFHPSNGGALTAASFTSGSGSATVNHGLSITPQAALVNNAAGTNSTTLGSGSYTATTVYIYQYSAMAWVAMFYHA